MHRCVITPTFVLVLNPESDAVLAFVEDLQRRCTPAAAAGGAGHDGQSPPRRTLSLPNMADALNEAGSDNGQAEAADRVNASDMKLESPFGMYADSGKGSLQFPFELRVLEVVLDTVSGCLTDTRIHAIMALQL